MKIITNFIFSLILLSTLVYGLDCQYTDQEKFYVEEERYFYGNDYIPGYVNITDITYPSSTQAEFKVFNSFNFDVNISITYMRVNKWFGGGFTQIDGIAKANQYTFFRGYLYRDNSLGHDSISDLKIMVTDSPIEKRLIPVEHNTTVCKQCVDKACINDGDVCQKNSECGGGYCVEGKCSNSESCYENNCGCEENGKIQCNSDKCVDTADVPLDVKPSCGLDAQCQSGYINLQTGLCTKSPSQIKAEQEEKALADQIAKDNRNKEIMIGIIILGVVIVVGIGVALYLKNKHEKERQKTEYAKQKTLQMKTELVMKQLYAKNEELENIQKEIVELTKSRKMREQEIEKLKKLKKTKDEVLTEIENNKKLREEEFEKHRQRELDKLNKLKKDKELVLNEIGDIEKNIDTKWENLKPFPDPQAKNRLVIINPYLGGYKCFYNKELELKEYLSSSLVHRWVWRHHNGSWPRRGYHIHHKDDDKYNNTIENLQEIEGDEHYEMHRGK